MTRKYEITDDDGNALAPPPPESDVSQAIYLLEYCRLRGFRVGPTVKVGELTMQVVDIRQASQMSKEGNTPDLEPGSDMDLVLNH